MPYDAGGRGANRFGALVKMRVLVINASDSSTHINIFKKKKQQQQQQKKKKRKNDGWVQSGTQASKCVTSGHVFILLKGNYIEIDKFFYKLCLCILYKLSESFCCYIFIIKKIE